MTIWKNTTQAFQTIGTPPRIGSTMRATIGSTRNSSSPLSEHRRGEERDDDRPRGSARGGGGRGGAFVERVLERGRPAGGEILGVHGWSAVLQDRYRGICRRERAEGRGPGPTARNADQG